jgi:uncharacterized protein (TIGR02284 family)
MKTNEQVIEVLNDLVRINNDRVAGYERAIKELPSDEGDDLKDLFSRMASESRVYANELSEAVRNLGGKVATDTTISGKIYRIWMDIKNAMSADEEKSVLASCEYGEDAAQRAYEKALDEKELPADTRELIATQKRALRESHDLIKRERDLHKAH